MRDRTTQILIAVALGLAGVAWYRGGLSLVLTGLLHGAQAFVSIIPLLLAAFLIAGLAQAMITQKGVTRWLGAGSGWRGIALACIGGALIPGGPFIYYPIVATLLRAGASLGVLVAFVVAKNLWSVTRLPLEFALLGPHLTLIRLLVTLPLPPLMGFLAEFLFGQHMERIREAVPL